MNKVKVGTVVTTCLLILVTIVSCGETATPTETPQFVPSAITEVFPTPETLFEYIRTEYLAQPERVKGWETDNQQITVTMPNISTTEDSVIWSKTLETRRIIPDRKIKIECKLGEIRDIRSIDRGSDITVHGEITEIKVEDNEATEVKLENCQKVS